MPHSLFVCFSCMVLRPGPYLSNAICCCQLLNKEFYRRASGVGKCLECCNVSSQAEPPSNADCPIRSYSASAHGTRSRILISQRVVPECKFDVISAGPMPGFLPALTETRLKLHATSVDITKVYPSWCRGSLQISRYCYSPSTTP